MYSRKTRRSTQTAAAWHCTHRLRNINGGRLQVGRTEISRSRLLRPLVSELPRYPLRKSSQDDARKIGTLRQWLHRLSRWCLRPTPTLASDSSVSVAILSFCTCAGNMAQVDLLFSFASVGPRSHRRCRSVPDFWLLIPTRTPPTSTPLCPLASSSLFD